MPKTHPERRKASDGNRLIIEPVPRKNLVEVLAGLEPLGPDDQFPDVDETLLRGQQRSHHL